MKGDYEMKKFMSKIIMLFLIVFVLIGAYCKLATVSSSKYHGPNTAEQVKMSFQNSVAKEYNVYFLGNSRIYRGINPDKFTSVNSYNFAHDNDSYNQMYYKLLYLLDNGKRIDYLVIGTDYFQFSNLSDTRNYIYASLFPKEYLEDFEIASRFPQSLESIRTLWMNKQNGLSSCIQYILGKDAPENISYQKENGQYCMYGQASGAETIDRDYSILDIQYGYYKKIISLCEDEGIELFVIMPPLWKGEIASHSDEERVNFNKMIRNSLAKTPYDGHYINYSEEEGLSSYMDFIDITHLTLEAADNYSEYINNRLFFN